MIYFRTEDGLFHFNGRDIVFEEVPGFLELRSPNGHCIGLFYGAKKECMDWLTVISAALAIASDVNILISLEIPLVDNPILTVLSEQSGASLNDMREVFK